MLLALSKVWEHTFKNLFVGLDPFHKSQYGFRRKKSTVDGLCRVVQIAENCKRRYRISVLTAVDIKNTFKTPRWCKILMEVDAREMPRKLLTFLGNYLEDRKIVVRNIGTVMRFSRVSHRDQFLDRCCGIWSTMDSRRSSRISHV